MIPDSVILLAAVAALAALLAIAATDGMDDDL